MPFMPTISWHVLACMFFITVLHSNGPAFCVLVLHHMQLVPFKKNVRPWPSDRLSTALVKSV